MTVLLGLRCSRISEQVDLSISTR